MPSCWPVCIGYNSKDTREEEKSFVREETEEAEGTPKTKMKGKGSACQRQLTY
jgi:hypothetical protein